MENKIPQRRYWPYDEVTVSRDRSSDRFIFSAPWLSVQLSVLPPTLEKAAAIVERLSSGNMTPNDFAEVSWLFAGVAKYPLAYIIPRATSFGTDEHTVQQPVLKAANPASALPEILKTVLPDFDFKNFADTSVSKEWCWDYSSALQFSRTAGKDFDPVSLFSVARRFHLLNDLEHNKTSELIGHMGDP